MLAHVLERCGIATVQLASVRSYVERMRPPRALYCEFPLGRPLGRPNDSAYQRRVLESAFELLSETQGPVLCDFPDVIAAEEEGAIACTIPPRVDGRLPGVVEEARALRPAYERQLATTRRTTVGMVVSADAIPSALENILGYKDAVDALAADWGEKLRELALDIRAYYEEAAAALAEHTPAAREAERWFYEATETGRLFVELRRRFEAAQIAPEIWAFLVPKGRE